MYSISSIHRMIQKLVLKIKFCSVFFCAQYTSTTEKVNSTAYVQNCDKKHLENYILSKNAKHM